MKRLNTIFTINSFIVLIIIIERLSPTGKIFLQPFSFISLHQLNQSVIFLTAFIILSVFLLKELTNNFRSLHEKNNTFLLILFIAGAYLFGTGEGWHEVSNFMLHNDCHANNLVNNLCGGLFINSLFAGNIIFFVGGLLMNISLMAFAAKQPMKNFTNKDLVIVLLNSFVYALTWFAYAAFDKVLIGLFFSTLLAVISLGFLFFVKRAFKKYPYITYSAFAYSLATVATVLVRLNS